MFKVKFNQFNHSFECRGTIVVLNDETFKLLKLLYDANYRPIALKEIKQTIWDDEFLPDYSAKRLIQKLESELRKAEFDSFSIVYVENQGYTIKEKTSSRLFFLAAFAAMAFITFMFMNVISPMIRSTSMVNNRIILITQSLPSDEDNILYYEAAEQLRFHIRTSAILFLIEKASRDNVTKDMIESYDNVGLIIEWYNARGDAGQMISMEIREAKTNNLLSSTLLDTSNFNQLDRTLSQQVTLIEGLITSDLLPLNKVQLSDPYDPVWDKMRAQLLPIKTD